MANPSDELKNIFAGGGVRLKKVGPPREGKPLPSKPASKPEPAPKPPSKARKPKLIIKAEAEFDYEAEQEDELNFVEGEIFLVLNKTIYDGWALGEKGGKKGVFPNNFVRFFEEEEEPEQEKPIPRRNSGLPPGVSNGPIKAPPTKSPAGPPAGLPGPPTGKPTGPPPDLPSGTAGSRPPSSKPPNSAPPSSAPPSSAPPSSAPPSSAPTSRPTSRPLSENTDRSGSVAARAAFIGGALHKAQTGGTASLPRNMDPNVVNNFSEDNNENTISKALTATELRNYALEHKEEIRPLRKASSEGTRRPAAPETVISPADVRTKISSSRRRESEKQLKKPNISDPLSPSSPPTPSTPVPNRMSLAPVVEPPKPPTSPAAERKPLPPPPVVTQPLPPPPIVKQPLSPPPVVKPARSADQGNTAPLYTLPASKQSPLEVSDLAVSEGSDVYMYMSLDDDVAGLKSRIDVLETANSRLQLQVEELEKNKCSPATESSVTMEDMSAMMTRLETNEAASTKTNKLITLLQNDLDEEINTRKQLETEVIKLRRTVKLMQA
ncbi:CD2-associated protein-like isoform X2 [Bolinopsis microptera]|uniref:CD2-associated protein-like isoform X2 n=1 Tax=Bolinopsis microptera TaxID=2820187 RepID=UPI00307ABB49